MTDASAAIFYGIVAWAVVLAGRFADDHHAQQPRGFRGAAKGCDRHRVPSVHPPLGLRPQVVLVGEYHGIDPADPHSRPLIRWRRILGRPPRVLRWSALRRRFNALTDHHLFVVCASTVLTS